MNIKRILLGVFLLIIVLIALAYFKIAISDVSSNTCEIKNIEAIDDIDFKTFTTVTVSASNAYKGDVFKNLLQGENYRDAWQTNVELPILFLDTLYGGVTIDKIGGGNQTKSLRLEAREGLELTLRSINKNPSALVPKFLKNLGLENIVMDGISGQHPYAATVVAELSDAVNVVHTNPQTVFLPKQEILGERYNKDFGNKIYLLEFENHSDFNWPNVEGFKSVLDTEDLQELKSEKQNTLSIDKQQLIRARLFDIVIGDWDRHAKQWGWIVTEKDSLLTAIPIATDRDNAFFNVDGLINKMVTSKSITPHLQSFNKEIDYLPGLIYDFDVYFLQNTTSEDFVVQANYIKEHLTDAKIETAFKVWNTELYNLDAEHLMKTIKARRDKLDDIALKFKILLDAEPLLDAPLKGSDGLKISDSKIQCFEC